MGSGRKYIILAENNALDRGNRYKDGECQVALFELTLYGISRF
jgi:hypothetical protein